VTVEDFMSFEPETTSEPIAVAGSQSNKSPVELSIVMPCLNEAETLAICIHKAQTALIEHGIVGEVVVADNGSTDGSQAIAASVGARVNQERNHRGITVQRCSPNAYRLHAH
jgi:glycosyltransferase involved in cell wall biosynthesis